MPIGTVFPSLSFLLWIACLNLLPCYLFVGIPCQAYHAGRPAKERSRVLEDWNEGRVPVVAATIAFGMGIDRASKAHPVSAV